MKKMRMIQESITSSPPEQCCAAVHVAGGVMMQMA
jgi:hypothetical protein